MALQPPVSFQGTLRHPRTGEVLPYAGTCVVATDRLGRESLHVRGAIGRGHRASPLVVLGHVDARGSFIGREREAVDACVALHCMQEEELADTIM